MTHAYWHARVEAIAAEHNVKRFNQGDYWKHMASLMPDELLEAYLNNDLTLPGGRHGVLESLQKIFSEEMAERFLLR